MAFAPVHDEKTTFRQLHSLSLFGDSIFPQPPYRKKTKKRKKENGRAQKRKSFSLLLQPTSFSNRPIALIIWKPKRDALPVAPISLITNTLIRLALPIIPAGGEAVEPLGGVILALVVGVEPDGAGAAVAPVDADVVGAGGELDAAPAAGELGLGRGRDHRVERAGGVGEGADLGVAAGPFVAAAGLEGGEEERVVGRRGGGSWGGEGEGGGKGAQREEEEGCWLHGVCVLVFGLVGN